MTDRELLDQFVEECNEQVFESLVRRHGTLVFGVCRRILGNHHDAEEAFQATFLVLAKKARSISGRESLANWLFGVAHRTALKAKATRAKRFSREKQVESIPEGKLAKPGHAPEHEPEIEELLDVGLSRLPEKYRTAIVLCDLEGKSHREVGQELGCAEATVSSRVMRARTMLAKWFGRHGFVLSVGSLVVVLSQQSASASLPASLVASTAQAAGLSALGQPIAASVMAPHVVVTAKGVVKSMFVTTLKHAVVRLVLVIAIGAAAGGLVHWLQAAERPVAKQKKPPTIGIPKPLELLAKYEKTLLPYQRMKGIWTWTVSVWKAGEQAQLTDEAEECNVLRDGDRTRLLYKTTGGGRKIPRLWEEFLHIGKGALCASNDDDVVTGQLQVSEEEFFGRFGVARSSPGYGVIDGKSIPAFLHKAKLSVQADTLDGNVCFALRGVREDCDITIWLDPASSYVARRVVFNKRPTPNDLTTRTSQFNVKRFQEQAIGPVVAEASCTLTIGPQPIFRSVGFTKVVNGKTVVENPLIPATDNDGKIIMLPAKSCRWDIHTVVCELNPHLNDADFRMSVPIKNGTRVEMTDAPMLQYTWKDGAALPGGWKRNLRFYQNKRKRSASERFASSVRDARLSNLSVLVAAMGDATEPSEETLGKVLDFEESKDSLRYLPLVLSAAEVRAEPAFFAGLNLHPPKAGEILLAAFDGATRQAGVLPLDSRQTSASGRRGIDFLKTHAAAARDARQLLAEAQKKARQTDRRVWIVLEGSRCGPCFRLARWFDDQRALLDRDYVIVKLNAGLDDHVDEVFAKFKRSAEGGVPWFAIVDADGTPLATSEGPHGNIGFPSDQPAKLHFLLMLQKTAQRLNTVERERLVQSLSE